MSVNISGLVFLSLPLHPESHQESLPYIHDWSRYTLKADRKAEFRSHPFHVFEQLYDWISGSSDITVYTCYKLQRVESTQKTRYCLLTDTAPIK